MQLINEDLPTPELPENKEYVLISVADGIIIQMKRNYIVAVLPKGTLVATGAESK